MRIDEGTKRGPRNLHATHILKDESTRREAIPHNLDINYVLDLYLSEPRTSRIAEKLGVKRSTLTFWLREQDPERWKMVQILRALLKKEDGDEGIETARDALGLARAREMLRSGQWDLERLDAATFGPKQEVTHHASGPLIQINVAPIGQVALQQVSETAVSSTPLIQGK